MIFTKRRRKNIIEKSRTKITVDPRFLMALIDLKLFISKMRFRPSSSSLSVKNIGGSQPSVWKISM
jgi:hypothetical protein